MMRLPKATFVFNSSSSFLLPLVMTLLFIKAGFLHVRQLTDRRQSNLKVKKRNAWRYSFEAHNSFLAAASPARRVLSLDLLAQIAVPGNLSFTVNLVQCNFF